MFGRPREVVESRMDHDKIVNKRVQRIARDHTCSVAAMNAALDRHPGDQVADSAELVEFEGAEA